MNIDFASLFIKIIVACGVLVIAAFLVLFGYVLYKQHAYRSLPDSHDLEKRVENLAHAYVAHRSNSGIVIGLYQHGKSYIRGFGVIGNDDRNVPNRKTIFEIGSITKVFTALALARLSEKKIVNLDDPIRKYLPSGIQSPIRAGHEITLRELATHTSGLPRLPEDLLSSVKDQNNPYASYTTDRLFASLASAKLADDPGTVETYSNFGYGLLGQILAIKSSKTYDLLVKELVIDPLELKNTSISLDSAQQKRLAKGHNTCGEVVSNWDHYAMAPAGALRSDAEDMLKFVEVNLFPQSTSFSSALKETHKTHFKKFSGGVGLGWQIRRTVEKQVLLWHNGGTGGYASFIGFDSASSIGIVILSNSGDAMVGDTAIDRTGMEILRLAPKVSWN